MADGSSNPQTENIYDQLLDLMDSQFDSDAFKSPLSSLFPALSPQPEVKSYSDATYVNYFDVGMSLKFISDSGHQPKTSTSDTKTLRLESIDVYNTGTTKSSRKTSFKTFSRLPLVIPVPTAQDAILTITADTKGADFVSAFGEPTRKGGGQGSLSGSIDIWCEWPQYGLLVELSTTGPNAWEQGQHSIWKVLTIFLPAV
jgi:hypothetical protein